MVAEAGAAQQQLGTIQQEHEAQTREWELNRSTLELKIRETTMRGNGSASEAEELRTSVDALKRELGTVKSELVERHGRVLGLEKQLTSLQSSSRADSQAQANQIEQLQAQVENGKIELARANQELRSVRNQVLVTAEEESAIRLQAALNQSKKECETMLNRQKLEHEQEVARLNRESTEQVCETQNELERMRSRLSAEQTKLASQIEETNRLRSEVSARDQELARLQQVSNGDELRRRLESLKEVVTHTLREKAELEEEVGRLKERLVSQQQRGSVIQDLQDRLKLVKDMNSRLDQDNEELRLKLQTAQLNLRTSHEQNGNPRLAPKTAGARGSGSTLSRFPQATKKDIANQMSRTSMTRTLKIKH